MKIVYSPQAREDLREIKQYISEELANPTAAARITNKVIKDCSNLKSNPLLGAELKNKFDVDTDMRYLISANYIAFYRIIDNDICVIRIRDGRTNYLQLLFRDLQ